MPSTGIFALYVFLGGHVSLLQAKIDEIERAMREMQEMQPLVRIDDLVESDDDLRARLIYIGVSMKDLATMRLDKVAEQYHLRRRKKPSPQSDFAGIDRGVDNEWTRQYMGMWK